MTLREQYEMQTGKQVFGLQGHEVVYSPDYVLWLEARVSIRRELAENLIDDVCELLAHFGGMRNYKRYDNRCKTYEAEIKELQEALNEKAVFYCSSQREICEDRVAGNVCKLKKGNLCTAQIDKEPK